VHGKWIGLPREACSVVSVETGVIARWHNAVQESAEGILGRCQARLLRHSEAERRSEQIGQAVTVLTEGPSGLERQVRTETYAD